MFWKYHGQSIDNGKLGLQEQTFPGDWNSDLSLIPVLKTFWSYQDPSKLLGETRSVNWFATVTVQICIWRELIFPLYQSCSEFQNLISLLRHANLSDLIIESIKEEQQSPRILVRRTTTTPTSPSWWCLNIICKTKHSGAVEIRVHQLRRDCNSGNGRSVLEVPRKVHR